MTARDDKRGADGRYPYAEHDNGIVLTQPRAGEFELRPMTPAELAAREPALKIAKDVYRHANQAGVCYYEFWRLIADAIEAFTPSHALPILPEGWALVPTVPTEEMIAVAEDGVDTPDGANGTACLYIAMIDAAPQPPACDPSSLFAPSTTPQKPRGAYVPLTEHEIDLIRACLDDGTYTQQEQKDIGLLCNMATNCLLYAQEIDRLRTTPTATEMALAKAYVAERDVLLAARASAASATLPNLTGWLMYTSGDGEWQRICRTEAEVREFIAEAMFCPVELADYEVVDKMMEHFRDGDSWSQWTLDWSFEDGGIHAVRLDAAMRAADGGKQTHG